MSAGKDLRTRTCFGYAAFVLRGILCSSIRLAALGCGPATREKARGLSVPETACDWLHDLSGLIHGPTHDPPGNERVRTSSSPV